METVDWSPALADGPQPRHPQRVDESTSLRGCRVVLYDPDSGEWVRDFRAADDPYWYDEVSGQRWPVDDQRYRPVEMVNRATLHVVAAREPDYYQWQRDHRRPEVREYPAYLVWVE